VDLTPATHKNHPEEEFQLSTAIAPDFEKATYDRVFWRIIPFLFLCYVVAFLDRVNVGFAKLQMAGDLQFSDAVYGFGAGVFFIGYFIFEVPSNVILERVGAKIWIARIMVTWGIISSCFMFVETEFWFYTLRFLLGVAEAGFFPGVILYLTYWFPASRRARMTALFMTAIAISNVVGSPVSGAIMQYMDGINGWRGWQWLFLLEGIPSVIIGLLVLVLLDNGPKHAKWLDDKQRNLLLQRLAEDEDSKKDHGQKHNFMDAFRDTRVWALSVVYLCAVIGFYAVNFWMPTIIQELGIDKNDFMKVGLLSMIPWGIAAVAMVVVGTNSDRTNERRWHTAISMLVAAVGLLALALVGHAPVPSIIALTLVTAGLLSTVAIFWSLPTAFLSGTAAAAGIAWINSVGNLGGYFGPDMIGRIRTSTGSTEAAFFALAAIAVLGAVVVLSMRKAPKAGAVVAAPTQ
jgi:D-galactonate transporter